MKKNKFQKFADNYSSTDLDKIKFDWNGEFDDLLFDKNMEFRIHLCEYLIPQIDKVKIELVRDLFLETAKSSKATFGIYVNFHLYSQELLQRGGEKYLIDYLEGVSYTSDTVLSSGQIDLSKEKAKKLLNYFDEKRKKTTDLREKLLFNDYFRKRLEYHANK